MFDVLGPGHFGNVNESFDTLFEFHESAVIGDRNDLAADVRALGEFVLNALPGMFGELLEAQRNALLVFVEVKHLDL